MAEHLLDGSILNYLAAVHYRYSVTYLGNHAEVMRDKQH